MLFICLIFTVSSFLSAFFVMISSVNEMYATLLEHNSVKKSERRVVKGCTINGGVTTQDHWTVDLIAVPLKANSYKK